MVKLVGRPITKKAIIGLNASAIIETRHLTPSGVLFIEEMRAAFASKSQREPE